MSRHHNYVNKRKLICDNDGHTWSTQDIWGHMFRAGSKWRMNRFTQSGRKCKVCGATQIGKYKYTRKKGWYFKPANH